MKKFTTNRFYNGINTDLSFLERKTDVLLDALNVRLTSTETDGLFAVNIKGNIEEFDLGINNKPIGTVEYNGVLYILSVNTVTNEGQIGTFPSPKIDGLGGFERVYRPLQNYTLDNPNVYVDACTGDEVPVINRKDFITDKLNFNCEHQARVLARVTFDKSVNIYWTDNYNPFRSINVGFNNETGEYNNRYTSEYMLETGQINVISENKFIPQIKLDKIEPGGNFFGGHYFFFVRYLDIDFNNSSFLSCSAPIPIFNEQNQEIVVPGIFPFPPGTNTTGPMPYGTQEEFNTDKSITLTVTNLDQGAGFIEFAYIYYKSDTEYTIKLIDKRYNISSSSSITIKFLGNESVFDITLDELIAFKPTDSLFCKDIAQIDNKLYIANTRGIELDHPDVRTFFCKVQIEEDNTLLKSVKHYTTNATIGLNTYEYPTTNVTENPFALNELDVNENVGYFSGETYCFAGVPVFKEGFSGPAFPLKGSDNYQNLLANPNFNGIFRFTSSDTQTFFQNNEVVIKGVKFNMTNAIAFYNNSDFLKENLIGFYFCRAERNKNLLYQGLTVPTYTGAELAKEPVKDFNSKKLAGIYANPSEFYNYFVAVPLIERATPYIYNIYRQKPFSFDEYGITSYQAFTPGAYYDEGNFESGKTLKDRETLGIFSFDHFIDDGTESSEIINKSYIKKIAEVENLDWIGRAPLSTVQLLGEIPGYGYRNATEYPVSPSANTPIPESQNKLFLYDNMKILTSTDDKYGGFVADTYSVPSWDAVGVNVKGRSYVTKIVEGQNGDGLFKKAYDRASTENDEYCVSLPVAMPSFILVDLLSSEPLNRDISLWHNCIVNVYRENPDNPLYNIESLYDFKNQFFSQISSFIPIEQISTVDNISNKVFYQGDCFVSRSYLKIINKFDDSLGDEIKDIIAKGENGLYNNEDIFFNKIQYTCGLSLVTENKYNPSYRYAKGRNDFYPINYNFFNPMFNIANSPEANFYNKGYKRMLSPRQYIGIDRFKPSSDNSFPTRIRPSFKHILNSLKDGYLEFTAGDFKDFDFQYGPINALIAYNDQLFSFQDDAINMHPINERAVAQSSGTDTPFILGESRELTEFKRALSVKYGTQHQWSIVKGEMGIYGFDWNKNVFWRVSGEGFQNLGILKGCQKWIDDIVISGGKQFSDITEQLPDNPVCNQGIHSVYDRKYKEVIVTFIFGEDKDQTISFSEKTNFFGAKYSFKPTMYSELEYDLYSFSGGKFWRHDVNPKYDNFYGVQDPAFIEVVVNPDGEIAKHFDNIAISSNNVEFEEVFYKTQHQSATQNPFLGEFWNRAVYREFQWKLPIRRADAIIDSNLSLGVIQSRLRGRYLIINLKYADDKYMWVREIITAYTQSKA